MVYEEKFILQLHFLKHKNVDQNCLVQSGNYLRMDTDT